LHIYSMDYPTKRFFAATLRTLTLTTGLLWVPLTAASTGILPCIIG
jgi:hypothetical protein